MPRMGYVDNFLMNTWYAEAAENVERGLDGKEVLHRLVYQAPDLCFIAVMVFLCLPAPCHHHPPACVGLLPPASWTFSPSFISSYYPVLISSVNYLVSPSCFLFTTRKVNPSTSIRTTPTTSHHGHP